MKQQKLRRFTLKLKYKFLLCFYTGMILVSLVLGIYLYRSLHQQVIDKAGAAGISLTKQVSGSAGFLFQELYDASNLIFLDEDIRDLLDKARGKTIWANSGFQSVNISNFIVTKSYISTLSIYNDAGLPVYAISTDNTFGKRSAESSKELEIIRKAKEANGKPVWFLIAPYEKTFFSQNSQQKIGMCRMIKNRDLTDVSGYIIVTANESAIQNICVNFPVESPSCLLLISKEGQTLYQKGDGGVEASNLLTFVEQNNSGCFPLKTENGEMMLSSSIDARTGFRTCYLFPTVSAQQEFWSMAGYVAILMAFCLLFSVPIAYAVSTQFTTPMKKLLKSMESFQRGNFEEQVEVRARDEFGSLAEGFNKMVRNIDSLVKKNYVLQIKEREAELTALQAQINPHFLYNTLEMIYWEAEENGQSAISEMVLSLSKLFRLSLNQGNTFTQVKCELELTQNYLKLQKMRFGDRLLYKIDAGEDTLSSMVPKLVLQPFIENAILHGFGNKTDVCRLSVSVKKENGEIAYQICDNGAGMEQERILDLLKRRSPVPQSGGGYAIPNILDRLDLIYGKRYSLRIESAPGRGTRIVIRLPESMEQESEPS